MPVSIRFLLGDQLQEVDLSDHNLTVLDYLRLHLNQTGSKEGCAEGDCGACTVVIGELRGEQLYYYPINACIQLLTSIDGKQLITIENLQQVGGPLHPVQQAMVDQHASQCGFCTPGFVMALFALYQQVESAPQRPQIDEAIAGNLCRCTGYAPIVRAAQQALNDRSADGFHNTAAETVAQLKRIQRSESLRFQSAKQAYFAPQTEQELAGLLAEHPDACLIAGATDAGLWLTKDLRVLPKVIYLGGVRDLSLWEEDAEHIIIGAALTYRDALPKMEAYYPSLAALMRRIGGAQIRAAGTIGGNIANGSPIGDMPPALIALSAELVIASTQGKRRLALEEFFIEYGQQDLHPGEYVHSIILPKPKPKQHFASYKLSKRFDQDISAVCGAFSITLDEGNIQQVRVAFGGMAGTPQRSVHCERALCGNPWTQATIDQAKTALQKDYQPLTDMRAGKQYRSLAAQNLLQRFFIETSQPDVRLTLTRPQSIPLPSISIAGSDGHG